MIDNALYLENLKILEYVIKKLNRFFNAISKKTYEIYIANEYGTKELQGYALICDNLGNQILTLNLCEFKLDIDNLKMNILIEVSKLFINNFDDLYEIECVKKNKDLE